MATKNKNQKVEDIFDKEVNIVKFIRDFHHEIKTFPNTRKMWELGLKILDENKWDYWVDNSKDTLNPPDFYSNKYRLMMESMQVDEYNQTNENGKMYNPYKQHEKRLLEELAEKGIVNKDGFNIFIIPDGDKLIGMEHNYCLYLSEFKRVVQKHNQQIKQYRKNHPGFETIFLIFDTTSLYAESIVELTKSDTSAGNILMADKIHEPYLDQNFLNIISSLDCEYILWAMPYKNFTTEVWGDSEIPKINHLILLKTDECKKIKPVDYKMERLVSVEDNT